MSLRDGRARGGEEHMGGDESSGAALSNTVNGRAASSSSGLAADRRHPGLVRDISSSTARINRLLMRAVMTHDYIYMMMSVYIGARNAVARLITNTLIVRNFAKVTFSE